MWKFILLVILLFLSCTSRKVATGKPDHEPVLIVAPQEVDLNSRVIPRITNLNTILCTHIAQNDSVLMDSPTFNLIPDDQKEIIKDCAQNAGSVLSLVDFFPNDGRKFFELAVKGNWRSNLLQLHILELTFAKKGVVSVYQLSPVNDSYEIEKIVSTFSI